MKSVLSTMDEFHFQKTYAFSCLKYRAVVIFGLNALNGKIIDSKGSAIGAWDSSDAESLIQYSVYKGYTIHGWELGKNS